LIEINNFKAELVEPVMPDLIRHPELMCAFFLDSGSEAGMTKAALRQLSLSLPEGEGFPPSPKWTLGRPYPEIRSAKYSKQASRFSFRIYCA